jgi:hypothetical protein
VIYFSDNGPNSARWNGGMKGRKGSTDEGGVRSACLIRWPGKIRAGTKISQISGAVDLLPTLTAMAGVPRVGDKPLDGRDLSPLLRGVPVAWPERLIFSHQNGNISVRSQQHRYSNKGELFDMVADPGQSRDIAAEQPVVAAELRRAVAVWRAELPTPAKDERPHPIGAGGAAFPFTPLPARDGVANGDIRRSAPAPNCSYFVNWTNRADTITWDVEVTTAGDYEVEILHACTPADAGSVVELSFLGASRTGKIAAGWEAPFYTNQDTIPRPPAESRMKEFRPLSLGVLRLEKGRGPLTLRATEIAGRSVMEVRQVNLTLRAPGR